jgi:predicted nucleic acid-binding protein
MIVHYVIDPSALIQGYVKEPFTPHVLALLEQVPSSVKLHVPEFCLVECTNILWKHVRLQGMPREVAQQTVQDLAELVITIHPANAYLPDALAIGLDNQLPIYDAIYIALAQHLQAALITADGKQERKARQVGVTVKPLADFAPAD